MLQRFNIHDEALYQNFSTDVNNLLIKHSGEDLI